MNNNLLLEIKDLEVVYQTDFENVYALNKVNMTLNTGETLGLVGETGAGKTTTALSILKLLPNRIGKITNGMIKFNGIDIVKASENEMRKLRGNKISMIFQDPMTSLNPVIPIGEQIAESIELHNTHHWTSAQIEERVDQMLELVGISPNRKVEYPHQFSGGMKQRVVIAISLACNPILLIADEPTTALDVTIQAQVLAMMGKLKEELDTSLILITHDLGIVAQICDKVAVMYAGEIIEAGTMEDIFSRVENHPYTTGLFGSIPNLVTATRRLEPISGLMPDPTDLPSGCKFHPRCPQRMDICAVEQPPIHVKGTHQIMCHLFAEEGNVAK